ncbi:class I SAM-dependent methyltransferase [Mesorhizobium sp. B2-3-4]|uniref:class I SAM-dependent DNA methyltransferase n=1 Tax=Mesorhizobium sp. B2-3-4 TaxID=2589959 RepID=UPI001127074B|nr:class I SAM-dependent methyltransferase [Mesorhizobium sp. B2-3-4]TPM35641.1 class I SAM-dependent methyltransferase [Mesorhizobium sp. B2-3-4]
MTVPAKTLAQSRQTIESYEDYAVRYDEIVGHIPHPNDQAALERAAAIAGPGGHVLEIGSGPGRDADFLEGLGVKVRRTDATRRFLELQAARGKAGDLLDVITGELGGPYDAVVALAVLIHVPRGQIDEVLGKIAHSLRPGGAFVVSMREGDGETGGRYHTVDWRSDAFAARMEAAGMEVVSHSFRIGRKERGWNTFLAVKPQPRTLPAASSAP